MLRKLVAVSLLLVTSSAWAGRESCTIMPALYWFRLGPILQNDSYPLPDACGDAAEPPAPFQEGGPRHDDPPGPPDRGSGDRDDGDGTP